MTDWWKSFFDADYIHLWGQDKGAARSAAEAEGIWQLLDLKKGSRVLDAACGYGRLAAPIAERGALVVGVDQSEELLAQAEKDRGNLSIEHLRYVRHDLRSPFPEGNFDAAYCVFTSIGYGTQEDDLAIFKTLHGAVRPGGLVLLETMHRDLFVAFHSRGAALGNRLSDGTLMLEENAFDPIAGRLESRWFWFGPMGQGEKLGSLRLYTATELVQLLGQAGLTFLSAHKGCTTEPFKAEGPEMGGRIAILSQKQGTTT